MRANPHSPSSQIINYKWWAIQIGGPGSPSKHVLTLAQNNKHDIIQILSFIYLHTVLGSITRYNCDTNVYNYTLRSYRFPLLANLRCSWFVRLLNQSPTGDRTAFDIYIDTPEPLRTLDHTNTSYFGNESTQPLSNEHGYGQKKNVSRSLI